MLTGNNPFEAETPFGAAARVLAAEPSTPALTDPSIPPEFSAILRRCLAKQPVDRYRQDGGPGRRPRTAGGRAGLSRR